MTKREAEQEFLKYEMPSIRLLEKRAEMKDRPMRRQAWNDHTDLLCKTGLITTHQYETWSHPSWCK